MKTLSQIIILSSLVITNLALANNVRIPNEFMMKINPENFTQNLDQSNRNENYHSIDVDNTCLAVNSDENRFIYKTCDAGDLTQHFRYEQGRLKNSFDQCLTNLDQEQRTERTSFCTDTRTLIRKRTSYRWTVNFNSCTQNSNQVWQIETSSLGDVIFKQDDECLAFTGESFRQEVGCNFDLYCYTNSGGNEVCEYLNSVVGDVDFEDFRTRTRSCELDLTYGLENPDGSILVIEKLIPIVVPIL